MINLNNSLFVSPPHLSLSYRAPCLPPNSHRRIRSTKSSSWKRLKMRTGIGSLCRNRNDRMDQPATTAASCNGSSRKSN